MTDHQGDGLGHELGVAADTYVVPDGDLRAVVARGRRRAARQRRGWALVAVAGVVAAAVGVQQMSDGDRSGTPVAASGGAIRGDAGVAWSLSTPRDGLGMPVPGPAAVDGSGAVYALSTAPGEREPSRPNGVLWRSADGVDWSPASTVDRDLTLARLTAANGRLYAVATTAATSATGRPVSKALVAWSDDGGASFGRAALPYDVSTLPGTTNVRLSAAAIGSGPRGTLVLLTQSAALDVRALLPAGVEAPNGWTTTDTGVDLLGDGWNCDGDAARQLEEYRRHVAQPEEMRGMPCGGADSSVIRSPQEIFGVLRSFTFDELGVAGATRDAVRQRPLAFFAEPGSTDFERVYLGDAGPAWWDASIDAHDGGFEVVFVGGDPNRSRSQRATSLHSDDGRHFTPSTTLPDLRQVVAVGRVGGATLVVGATDEGAVVLRSDGAGGWTTTPLAQLVDPQVARDRRVDVWVAGVGEFGAMVSAQVADGGGASSRRVLVTRDGVTWSDHALADLVPGRNIRGVHRVVVSRDRAVASVAVGDCQPDCEGPSEQMALIAVAT